MNPDKLLEGQLSEEEEEEEDYVPGDSDEDDDDDLEYEYDSEYETESSTDSEEGLNVTVRTVMGQEFNFVVSPDSTVIDLKMAIFVNLNRMHPDTQVLKMSMLWWLYSSEIALMALTIKVTLLILILLSKVLTYLGEEMEEDEETMADYDIQVGRPEGSTPWSTATTFPHFQDGSTILLQPKLASGFISHPNR